MNILQITGKFQEKLFPKYISVYSYLFPLYNLRLKQMNLEN